MRRLLASALLLVGCSGSPTAPTPPSVPSTPLTVVARDGISGEVVTASVQQSGGMVTVTAPGFLTRSQPSAPTVYLWRQPEEYVRALVYGIVPALARWKRNGVTVALDAGLERHSSVLAESVIELARVTRLGFVALPPGSAADIRIHVDPSRVPAGSVAAITPGVDATYAIVAGDIFFANESRISDPRANTLLHELGHAIGLDHSPRADDVMYGVTASSNRRFSEDESRALLMMYSWRKAGNTFPDNEPQGLAAGRAQTYTIACH